MNRLTFLALLVLLVCCARDREDPSLRPTPVVVRTAEKSPISSIVLAGCRLEGAREAVLSVPAPGRVSSVEIAEGDVVSAGQVLVRLATDRAAESQVRRSEAMVSAARAELEHRASSLDRYRELFRSGAASRSDLDQAETAHEQARASYRRAVSSLEAERAGLISSGVTAPFDGTVTRIYVPEGGIASGPVVSMTAGEAFRSELLLSQTHMPLLREGLPVFFTTETYPGWILEGTVVSCARAVDPLSGLVPLTVQFCDTTGRAAPGLTGMASVVLRTDDRNVVLPQSSLIPTIEEGWKAAVVENGRASIRPVEVGIVEGTLYQILSGVSAGDSVISTGQHLLAEGDRVRAVER
ncbi:efflux RND transporter periplasmic adaptor subunit [Candidatus Fermentibacteria bacterium]|nr:efflux RND transporter periplasmic adaptor subunit [Candidatus Fermentibacteria bacterium]